MRCRRIDQVAIVDGTLVPSRDQRLAARSKNYRYSTNLQVAIDADTRLPRLRHRRRTRRPTRRWPTAATRATPKVITPYANPATAANSPTGRRASTPSTAASRARAEHALARVKNWTIPRDYRRAAHTLHDTASGIARLHNLALTG